MHAERDGRRDERADERVVVASAARVDREHGVPADESRRERRPAGAPRDRDGRGQHGKRGEALEEPGGSVGRGPGDPGDGLGEERERRAVHAGRVPPVGAEVGCRRALGECRRRVDVRVPATLARDPAVAPVRPGVGREKKRRRERNELHGRSDEDCGAERERTATQEDEADEVRDERGGDQAEEEPGGPLYGETTLPRNERRAVAPRRGRRDPDETGCGDARGERRRPGGHGSAGRPPFAEAPP